MSSHAEVETKIQEAMLRISSVQGYETVLQEFFTDGVYSLVKGCILFVFTQKLMGMHPQISQQIADAYSRFLIEHFDPLDIICLLLE